LENIARILAKTAKSTIAICYTYTM